MTIGKGLRHFLLVALICLKPFSSFCGEVTYKEHLDLQVTFDSEYYQFFEVYNGREPQLLFQIERSQLPWFIASGKDLVDFQRRKQKLARFAVAGVSAYLFMSVNILVALGTSLVMEEKAVPKPDETLGRVAYEDSPYLLISSKDSNFSEQSFEYDVADVIDSYIKIYGEFSKRMQPIWSRSQEIEDDLASGSLQCLSDKEGNWDIQYQRGRFGQTRFKAEKILNENRSVDYRLSPVVINDETFPNWNWPGYRADDSTAIVYFGGTDLDIQGVDLGSEDGPSFPKRSLNTQALFANVGNNTASVDQTLIISGQRLKPVFDWTLALQTCLKKSN